MDHASSTTSLQCTEQYSTSDIYVGNDVTVESDVTDLVFREQTTVPATRDPCLLGDERVLANMLQTEERYALQSNCFETVQKDVELWMRNRVAHWLLEVGLNSCIFLLLIAKFIIKL